MTSPGNDAGAFQWWKERELEQLRHLKDSPEELFREENTALAFGGSPRHGRPSLAVVEQAQLDRIRALWLERTSNFNGGTFVIVGDMAAGVLQPLVERYLGSLPSKATPDAWRDPGIKYPKAKVERVINAGHDERSRVFLEFSAPDRYSLETERDFAAFQELLHARLDEVLREKLSSIYYVGVEASITREPTVRRRLLIWLNCAPDNVQKLRKAVFDELTSLAASGIDDAYLATLGRQMRVRDAEQLSSDAWWLRSLSDSYRHGDNFEPGTRPRSGRRAPHFRQHPKRRSPPVRSKEVRARRAKPRGFARVAKALSGRTSNASA